MIEWHFIEVTYDITSLLNLIRLLRTSISIRYYKYIFVLWYNQTVLSNCSIHSEYMYTHLNLTVQSKISFNVSPIA